jgi:hypothetical protein
MMLTRRSSISPFRAFEATDACATSGVVATVATMCAIDDGSYDVVVIEAHESGDESLLLELVITAGALRGEVVRVHARSFGGAWTDLLGAPATLTVTDGKPHISQP